MRKLYAFLCLGFALGAGMLQAQTSAPVPARVVLGARAVVMVADAVFAFPGARAAVYAVAGTDQGLGSFLEAVSPGFLALPGLDRKAGAEAYAALKPDLIILKGALRATLGVQLEALGLRVLYLELESPEDYYRDLSALGRAFNAEGRASELSSYYERTIEFVAERTGAALASGARRSRVLIVQATASGWQVPPDGWMQTRMVELAGGLPVWKGSNPGSGWATVGQEQIAAWDPDQVLVVDYGRDASLSAAEFRADGILSGLRAVRAGAVSAFPQDSYSWDQPDTRWALGLLWMARQLYPKAMEGVSLEGKAREFFSLFYGLEGEAFDRAVKSRFTGSW